jgi:ribosome biogenesis GTPase A
MKKTKDLIVENLKLIDVVVEIVDARVPMSSRNPEIDKLVKDKKRIIVLNKIDLASDSITERWIKYFNEKGIEVILVNSINGKGINKIPVVARNLMKEKIERDLARGRKNRPVKAMIVGIPNVGKSTFINKIVGKGSAKTGNKPGVTRGKQWIKLKNDLELLDTPGILWPKFEDMETGYKLAFIGSVKDDILDIENLSCELIRYLRNIDENILMKAYNLEHLEEENGAVIEQVARSRGFVLKGDEPDYFRTAKMIIDEFRSIKLGKITLEIPEEFEEDESEEN